MQEFLKNRDLFGHPVQLNFNKKGSQHTTVVGGVVSIIVKVLMLTYVGVLMNRMIEYKDDQISSSVNILDFENGEGVKLSNMSRV